MVQAARQAAEQRSEELSDQVDKLTQQSVEAAVESQSCLDAAIQKAAKEAEKAKVMLFVILTTPCARRHTLPVTAGLIADVTSSVHVQDSACKQLI